MWEGIIKLFAALMINPTEGLKKRKKKLAYLDNGRLIIFMTIQHLQSNPVQMVANHTLCAYTLCDTP